MNRRLVYIIIGVVVILAILTGGYFIVNGNKINTSSKSNNSGNTTQNIISGTVDMRNFAFNPATVTVSKGNTVTWTNSDSSTHRIVADDGSFDLGNQDSGTITTFNFTKVGTFSYHCAIHPTMKGIVIVK